VVSPSKQASKQANIYTHGRVQRSNTSVGLAQVRPNNPHYKRRSLTLFKSSLTAHLFNST